jgi:hypothetical protein
MSNINISGAIGASFFKKNKKKIIIFFDDHSNMKYCDSSYFINNFFDEINENIKNSIILLEEPLINEDRNSNIVFLWNDVPHIIKSKQFYKKIINECTNEKICRVFPIDIRLCLIDVSIEEYFTEDNNIFTDIENLSKINSDLSQTDTGQNKVIKIVRQKTLKKHNNKSEQIFTEDTVGDYFKYFIYLFDCGEVDESLFIKETNIYFIKEVFSLFKDNNYYIETKNKFVIFFDKFIKSNINETMTVFIKKYENMFFEYKKGFPFINDDEDNFISQFNRIHNSTMEFYATIIIVHSNYNNIILYSGYYHSNNISYILEKHFGFINERNIGDVDDIDNIDENAIKSCVKINKNIILEYLK